MGELYVGSTNDLRRRLREHNEGTSVSTKRYAPWYLVSYEAYQAEDDAREREQKLKAHGNALKEFKRRSRRSLKNDAGFTLLEMLLSVALIALIAGISLPVYLSMQTKNDLDIAVVSFVQAARRAQVLARGVSGDTSWGVYAQSGSITMYKGTSYAARDTDYDETTSIPSSISISGSQNFLYAKFTGLPTATGTTTFTSTAGDSRSVGVGAKGTLSY